MNLVQSTSVASKSQRLGLVPDKAPSATRRGLDALEAQARLATEGYNELPRADQRTPLRIILEVLREPMLALLLGGGVIYLVLGDLKEAIILLAFAMMSVMITVILIRP